MKRIDLFRLGSPESSSNRTTNREVDLDSAYDYQKSGDKDSRFFGPEGDPEEVVIERPIPGKPHKGKVLLAIQAHSDDVPLDYGGTVAKLMDEGYTGYLLRQALLLFQISLTLQHDTHRLR